VLRPPSFEPRRRTQLNDEFVARARAWLTGWHPRDNGDFATALFQIGARLESEVTQRLDKVPLKTFRAFLDWLGVKALPGRAAKLPVVFTMTPGSDPIDAPERVRLQVNSGDTPVIFETIEALRILPGTLATLVAVDPAADAFYLPTPSVFNLAAPTPTPTSWQLKSDAPVGATTIQLDPPLGLVPGLTLADPSAQEYRVTAVQGAIVTIEPPIGTIEAKGGTTPAAGSTIVAGTVMTLVSVFTPFSATERNRQQHVLYIGSTDGLNIDTNAWIAIQNGATIPADATWSFSGTPSAAYPDGWIPIDSASVVIQGSDLLLQKPAGSVQTKKIDPYQSRWLRAIRAPGNIATTSHANALRLLVNCELPPLAPAAPPVTALEGIANTTPLVLAAGFYPFGRTPRQFDSFYLGSKEAFSKPAAKVTAQFVLGEQVTGARVAIGISDTDYLTAGVGADGRLQRIEHGVIGGGAQTPTPTISFLSPTQPVTNGGTPISLSDGIRPGGALLGTDPYITAPSGNEVWLWSRTGAGENWQSLGTPDAHATAVTQTILTRTAVSLAAYAIADGALFRGDLSGSWTPEIVNAAHDTVSLVAPVISATDRAGEQTESDGVVAVTDNGGIYIRDGLGVWTQVNAGKPVDETFFPTVVKKSPAVTLCFTRDKANPPVPATPHVFEIGGADVAAPGVTVLGDAVGFISYGDDVAAVMIASDAPPSVSVAFWSAALNGVAPIFNPAAGQPNVVGGLLPVGTSGTTNFFLATGPNGETFVLPVGAIQFVPNVRIAQAIVVSNDPRAWTQAIEPLVDLTPTRASNVNHDVVFPRVFAGSGTNRWILLPDPAHAAIPDGPVCLYASFAPGFLSGTVKAPAAPPKIALASSDSYTTASALCLTDNPLLPTMTTVIAIKSRAGQVATLYGAPPWPPPPLPAPVSYKDLDAGDNQTIVVRPTIDLTNVDPSIVSALSNGTVLFNGFVPASQTVTDVLQAANVAVLSAATTAVLGTNVDIIVLVNPFGSWSTFAPPPTHNPTLSWEYYDGTAWRPIPGLTDGTQALAQTGKVIFCVPKDLKATDVVGQTNSWIRARLVGGDYGQETVTVTTSPGSTPGTTIQTVNRSTDSIRAPYVGSLTVTYTVCCAVTPDVVLTFDNGTLVNQTNINASAGAMLDYFVPLADALARISGGDASAGDRALFLGFDTPLTGGPIDTLFLVNDGTFDAAYPLRVDALLGNRLKAVVAQDNTRGLNETGTVEITLAQSPQLSSLFGAARYWLRLRPSTHLASPTDWQPAIRAAYVNATWAEAADTQTFERLGSSDGSPTQQFGLARPPVISGSLRLRVLESLGDDDVAALKALGVQVDAVLTDSTIPEQDGYFWVLWSELPDISDAANDARVYSLDDVSGTVTFGDGQHGMIPPIGANVILAQSYQHGGGEAANAVTAWTTVSLVSPLSGVSGVVPPDDAAGGSDAQDDATTLRLAPANLRLRGRALTPRDFEMLALQFSRDIAQARAIQARGGINVVVAVRGGDPTPGAAVLRQLRAYLLSVAPPMLAATGVLTVSGPREVSIHIDLTVIVDVIESSGPVSAAAQTALTGLLDPASGGHDGLGWPIGAAPSDTDIAAALDDIDHLEGIESPSITRADGTALGTLAATDLVRLATDGLTLNVVLPDTVVTP
jgi:hypothetical protein